MKAQLSMKLILIGLLSQIDFSQSRAVNISNTWTLPQPGFNVFYRYFRDKISWFEADAVCQFHHANLVTVENIEQFDSARGFLKELDISENVWIGLMRPTNADQFSWTNSKPLLISEGYWAEPWPVADTPLCAVIDPARDYRWHALGCGGPETAAFLCEMEIPDWALHCTENSEITVQYISDSGAVQLSRHCQDSVKEISCQQRMNSMQMYEELRCPEEQTTLTTDASTFFEVSSTTTEESRPQVIIKNSQKMLEDVFNNIEVNIEVDSNRLDVADAKKDLDLMVGDQPVADMPEDKKTLLKLSDKKEILAKKSKNVKKESKAKESSAVVEDEEMMMGDAPVADNDGHLTTVPPKPESSTTDRQRRDASETTLSVSTETASSTSQSDETDESSTTATELTTETPQITTVVPEEPTTKIIVQGHPLFHSQIPKESTAEVDRKDVQGHPLFHSQVVFKEPIPVDTGNGLERKDTGNSDDHFVPPMMLVKARFTATKSTEGTEETKEMTTDIATSPVTESTVESQSVSEPDDKNTTSKPTEGNEISTNEISLVTQLETTSNLEKNEKPIKIEKRNDPRLGLNAITAATQAVSSTILVQEITTEAASTTTEQESSTTEVEVSASSTSYESSISEVSTTESQTEISEASEVSSESSSTKLPEALTSAQPESTAERLIESTTHESEMSSAPSSSVELISMTPIAYKLTTLRAPEASSQKPISKSIKPMRNDIDARPHEGNHESSHELHENSDENESYEHHQHIENALNNEENYQPYKPNRHRTISKLDHHHGSAFSIGKILGK